MSYKRRCNDRQTTRLRGYAYNSTGIYYVTICTESKGNIFGYKSDASITLNEIGKIAQTTWLSLTEHYSNIYLDTFIIMPDHVHGIITLLYPTNSDCINLNVLIGTSDEPKHMQNSFPKPLQPGSLPVIVRAFKSSVTREVNILRGTPGATLWQGRYYDHIIRNDTDLARIRRYIVTNPDRWKNPPS
ncbi:MAG: transposase [Oscillochloridaceae bacterium umkhey_bin13]